MKVLIFDMDGTIIDSANAMTKSINYVRNHYGLGDVSVEMIKDTINNVPDANLPQIFYETDTYLEEHRALFKESYVEVCKQETRLFDGIYELLATLKENHKIAIATNAHDMYANLISKAHGIDKYIDYIIGSNMVSKGKPDPEMIEKVIDHIGGQKDKTIMIGDTYKDQGAALNAGIEFIYVDWGFGDKIDAKYVARDSAELMGLINMIQDFKK